jgi:hypothetical protein
MSNYLAETAENSRVLQQSFAAEQDAFLNLNMTVLPKISEQ